MNHVALCSERLDYISLCTGGGGLDLGIELAVPSARAVCCVEREAFAVSHLVSAMQQGLMAQAPIWSDVTTFDGRPWRGLVDGVIGGIPCQPHSHAGKRQGSDDERDLWSDARRIIVQFRPWFVLIENVSGMLTAKSGLDPGALRVRRDLQRLGFDVEGGLFTAAEVGASHERKRIFILAVADTDRRQFAGRSTIGSEAVGWRPCDEFAGSSTGFSTVGIGQADSDSERLERVGADTGARGRENARGPAGLCGGTALAYANSTGLAFGQWPAIERGTVRNEGEAVAPRGDGMADANGRQFSQPERRPKGRNGAGSTSEVLANTDEFELWREPSTGEQLQLQRDGTLGLFAPGPSDLSSWAGILASAPELEPAFRRVANGLASRLDVARVDRLRMLGNGVVPLEAAYAVRTLAVRLAERSSKGAIELVRLMGIPPK